MAWNPQFWLNRLSSQAPPAPPERGNPQEFTSTPWQRALEVAQGIKQDLVSGKTNERLVSGADAALSVGSALPGMAVAGAAALPWTVLPGQKASDVFENVLNLAPKLAPQTKGGQEMLEAAAQPGGLIETIDKPFRWVGDQSAGAAETLGLPAEAQALLGSIGYTAANLVGPQEALGIAKRSAQAAKELPQVVADAAMESAVASGTAKMFGGRLTPAERQAYSDLKVSGKSEPEIFQETGLFEALDGTLRKWFPDTNVAVAEGAYKAYMDPNTKGELPVREALTGFDPEFVRRYPEVMDQPLVTQDSLKPGNAYARIAGGQPWDINLSAQGMADAAGAWMSPERRMGGISDALHELQHGVDALDTGRTGTNPKAMDAPAPLLDAAQKLRQAWGLKQGTIQYDPGIHDASMLALASRPDADIKQAWDKVQRAIGQEKVAKYQRQGYEVMARLNSKMYEHGYQSPADLGPGSFAASVDSVDAGPRGMTPNDLIDVPRDEVWFPERTKNPDQVTLAAQVPGSPRLEGLPEELEVPGRGRVPVLPNEALRRVAQSYAQERGLPYNPISRAAEVDPAAAREVARAFEEMPHAPNDPKVKSAYQALASETVGQLQSILGTGLKIEFIKPGMPDPYAASPRGAILDIQENNHLWVYPTDDGFGGPASSGVDISGNPLLADAGIEIDGRRLKVNDAFRIVHDVFGHAMEGNGFRANGEETAARIHADLFSPEARKALMTETRGQNSWVNFGPYAEKNAKASGATTEYAPQKTGLLPDWATERDYQVPRAGDTTINVGMNVGNRLGLDPKKIRAALKSAGAKVKYDEVRVSGTEPTFVAQLDRPLTPEQAMGLSEKLKQEAIAQRTGDKGALFGPKADAWGPFNPEFFLDPSELGQRLSPKAREQLGRIRAMSPAHAEFIDNAAKYLTPEELDRLNAKTVDRLQGFMGEMTSVDDLVNMAFAGKAKKGWYRESAEAIQHLFGDDAQRFTGLLAALSPQTSVESNLENALKVWAAWNKAGRPTDDAAISRILGENVQSSPLPQRSRAALEKMSQRLGLKTRAGTGKKLLLKRINEFAAQSPENADAVKQISVLDAWKNNSLRALKSGDELKLSGPKVDSFMRNLLGDLYEVTNDTWQAKAMNVMQKFFGGAGALHKGEKLGLKGPGYLAGNVRTREAAEQLTKLTGEDWSPAEVQETVWSFVKALSELADEQKLSLEDAWQHPDFTNEKVAGIPDFGTLMRTNPRYSRLLEDAGYGEQIKSLQVRASRFDAEAAKGHPRTLSGGADAELARRLERGRALNAKGQPEE